MDYISRKGILLFLFLFLMGGSALGRDYKNIVDPFFVKYGEENAPGGAVGIYKNGEIIFEKTFGFANLEKQISISPETNFRLASVTKQFTAMAVMILNDQSLLNFEDTLDKFWPDFPEYGKSVTIRNLLNHTSGIIDYEDILPEDISEPIRDRGVLELMKRENRTYFTPGAEYKYSNTAYALLAILVEDVSGKSFATFLKENIFDPLGMKKTVAFEKGISEVENRAYGYKPEASTFKFADQNMTSSVLGDGGIYCSIKDYIKWDQALYSEKLVKKETLQEAFSPATLNDGSTNNYGFGWRFDEIEVGPKRFELIYHNGSTTGFRTSARRVPELGFCVIVLMNRSDGQSPEISLEILKKILTE